MKRYLVIIWGKKEELQARLARAIQPRNTPEYQIPGVRIFYITRHVLQFAAAETRIVVGFQGIF